MCTEIHFVRFTCILQLFVHKIGFFLLSILMRMSQEVREASSGDTD